MVRSPSCSRSTCASALGTLASLSLGIRSVVARRPCPRSAELGGVRPRTSCAFHSCSSSSSTPSLAMLASVTDRETSISAHSAAGSGSTASGPKPKCSRLRATIAAATILGT
ncbi:MAG: hypothetical protein U0168_26570 [Nannocystaceae bacterium]